MSEPYPPPMIDTRYLRRANGTATEQDLREIAELEARLKAGGSYYPTKPAVSSTDRYYKVKLNQDPEIPSRRNWLICDNTRLGGGQVAVCDKEGDADHIVTLLNRFPDRKEVLA